MSCLWDLDDFARAGWVPGGVCIGVGVDVCMYGGGMCVYACVYRCVWVDVCMYGGDVCVCACV